MPNFFFYQFFENVYINAIVCVGFFQNFAIICSIATLFLIFVCIAIVLFRELLKKMQEQQRSLLMPSELELETWKQHYVLICQLISQINSCFGIIILITLCFGYIDVTNSLFKIISSTAKLTPETIGTFIDYFLVRTTQLFLIMYSSSCLEFEVSLIFF